MPGDGENFDISIYRNFDISIYQNFRSFDTSKLCQGMEKTSIFRYIETSIFRYIKTFEVSIHQNFRSFDTSKLRYFDISNFELRCIETFDTIRYPTLLHRHIARRCFLPTPPVVGKISFEIRSSPVGVCAIMYIVR